MKVFFLFLSGAILPFWSFGIETGVAVNKAYIPNLNNDTVSVVDLNTAVVLKNIDVGNAPKSVAVAHDGSRVYILDEAPSELPQITVIDPSIDEVVDTLEIDFAFQLPTGGDDFPFVNHRFTEPDRIWPSGNSDMIYVSNRSTFIVIVDMSTKAITGVNNRETLDIILKFDPYGGLTSDSTGDVFVKVGNGEVARYDALLQTEKALYSNIDFFDGFILSPDEKTLISRDSVGDLSTVGVESFLVNSIDPIDADGSFAWIRGAQSGDTDTMVLSMSDDTVYVMSHEGRSLPEYTSAPEGVPVVASIDLSSGVIIDALELQGAPQGMDGTKDGSTLALVIPTRNVVAIVRTDPFNVVGHVTVGPTPTAFENFILSAEQPPAANPMFVSAPLIVATNEGFDVLVQLSDVNEGLVIEFTSDLGSNDWASVPYEIEGNTARIANAQSLNGFFRIGGQ